MLVYETDNKLETVSKIERLKVRDVYVIRFNESTIYKSYDNKDISNLDYDNLCKYLKSERLVIIKNEQ